MSLTFKTNSFEDAKTIRERVFMIEQGFQDEFDEIDNHDEVICITAYDQGELVGCARIFPSYVQDGFPNAPETWIFGRLAVLPEQRKSGYGSAILAEAERCVKEHGATEMHLHAQVQAQPFYERAGYIAYGPIEFDEHVEHQWMSKSL
ncbi:GNAT family N-acetyltransferase [Eggerthellaceae bacterium 3-80]|nr:GNAT family N-acetyltransferase [bacterium D16-34]